MDPQTASNSKPLFLKGPLLLAVLLIFSLFTWLRFHQLNVRPMHNDESVNAFFLTNLIKTNSYRYDPNNYHGPSLYYIQLVPTWINTFFKTGFSGFSFQSIAGITDWSIRGVTAATGLVLLLGLLFTFNRIGLWGALTAFLLAGFSCDLLYFSRYFIHEIFFVLFTLGIYLGSTWYLDTRKSVYFYLLVLSAGLVFCTKETSVMTYFVLGFSVVCTEVVTKKSPGQSFRWFFDGIWNKYPGALMAALLIWFLLYTSFFTNFGGLADSLRTYAKWTQEGLKSGHEKPFFYFINKVLVPYELGIVILSALGLVISFLKKEKTGLYLSFWTMGMVAAYSLVPYKTVWCVLNLLLPMVLLSGYGVQSIVEFIQNRSLPNKPMAFALLGASVFALSVLQFKKTWAVVYVEYDAEKHVQPYVHTSRDVFNLIRDIERRAEESKLGKDIRINVVSPVYWPIPFYLRDYSQALFWGTYEGVQEVDAPLLVASREQEKDLKKLLKDKYVIHAYTIRPGTVVDLYINQK